MPNKTKHSSQKNLFIRRAISAEEVEWSPKQNTLKNQSDTISNTIIQRRTNTLHHTEIAFSPPIRSKIYSRTPVTLIPKHKLKGNSSIHPLQEEYRDVNSNKTKIESKIPANVEAFGKKKTMELILTTKSQSTVRT